MADKSNTVDVLIDQVRAGLADNTLDAMVGHAQRSIDGCRWAGVTVRRGDGYHTLAATDPLVLEVDQAQYDSRQGQCVDAVTIDQMYLIDDITTEDRWPAWTPAAARAGVMSVLSVPMFTTERTEGALNLYGDRPGGFTRDDLDEAVEFAHAAARLLAVNYETQHLRTALMSRRTIGAAQGILRCGYGLTVDQAHRVLVRVSRDNNVKLTRLAGEIVEANGIPDPYRAPEL